MDIDARLERLERENRMMKRETLQVRRLEIVDETGSLRAVMDADGIRYADENGTVRAVMHAEGIGYWDENGTIRAVMQIDGIEYYDENGEISALLGTAAFTSGRSGAAVVLMDQGKVIWQAP